MTEAPPRAGLFFCPCSSVGYLAQTTTVVQNGAIATRNTEPDMNASQTEAIANADAHTSNAGLPTYSELLACIQYAAMVGRLAASNNGQPEYSRRADALLARIPA